MNPATKSKTALVTGASSGIGREIAQLLARRGVRVFGTARNPRTVDPLLGVTFVAMDVTDDASVKSGIEQIQREAGIPQWVVNNAGYGLTGAAEETSVEESKQQFETNFFGVLRVTNAVLPGMRRAGYGRLVNLSSVVGFLPAPYMSMYAASKHAVEGYSESLDHEVRRWGVRVALIEPAFTKSNISHSGKDAAIRLREYAEQRALIKQATEDGIKTGDDPVQAAEAVWKALTAENPELRYPVGKGKTLSRLRRFLPANVFSRAIRKQFKLD